MRPTHVYHLLKQSNPREGFSLLEVVIASFIFLTALVFMVGLWASYHSAISQSRHRLVANGLARTVMEQRIAEGYGNLDLIVGAPQVQTFQANSQIRGRAAVMNFTTTFLATDSAASNSTMRRITVTVEWEEDTGEKSLVYESVLYQTQ